MLGRGAGTGTGAGAAEAAVAARCSSLTAAPSFRCGTFIVRAILRTAGRGLTAACSRGEDCTSTTALHAESSSWIAL